MLVAASECLSCSLCLARWLSPCLLQDSNQWFKCGVTVRPALATPDSVLSAPSYMQSAVSTSPRRKDSQVTGGARVNIWVRRGGTLRLHFARRAECHLSEEVAGVRKYCCEFPECLIAVELFFLI